MIVVPIQLYSAVTGEIIDLGTMIISNTGEHTDPNYGDYHVRMYKKGDLTRHKGDARRLLAYGKTIREARVFNHQRKRLPVQVLVRRALDAMEYSQ